MRRKRNIPGSRRGTAPSKLNVNISAPRQTMQRRQSSLPSWRVASYTSGDMLFCKFCWHYVDYKCADPSKGHLWSKAHGKKNKEKHCKRSEQIELQLMKTEKNGIWGRKLKRLYWGIKYIIFATCFTAVLQTVVVCCCLYQSVLVHSRSVHLCRLFSIRRILRLCKVCWKFPLNRSFCHSVLFTPCSEINNGAATISSASVFLWEPQSMKSPKPPGRRK